MSNKFQVVEQVTDEPVEAKAEKVGLDLLMLGLKAVSARALAAIADLFMLVTVGSAFWLWYQIPDPNAYQITSLALYGVFVLAANWIVRRKT